MPHQTHTKDKRMSNVLNKIRAASRLGYTRKLETSIVDILLNAHWCEEKDLVCAYQCLEENAGPEVIVLFQLPFLIRLPEEWIPIRSGHGRPRIRFRPTGSPFNLIDETLEHQISAREGFGVIEKMQNAFLPNDIYGVLVRTQVVASFSIWEPRSRFYVDYLKALSSENAMKSVLVSKELSWTKESVALTPGTYEMDLAKRLHREMLSAFIPTYSVACKDPSAHPMQSLDSFIMMVKTGRIVILDQGQSMLAQYAKEYRSQDFSKNLGYLQGRFESNRPPTIYERYLLEAIRQVEIGSSSLAVVQSVMILDWFANETIQQRLLPKIKGAIISEIVVTDLVMSKVWGTLDGNNEWSTRVSTLEKFRTYFPAIGMSLTPRLTSKLIELVQLRNTIVHQIQVEPIKPELALTQVETAMNVIQHCLGYIFDQKEKAVSGNGS
jgi:hypothetical protein